MAEKKRKRKMRSEEKENCCVYDEFLDSIGRWTMEGHLENWWDGLTADEIKFLKNNNQQLRFLNEKYVEIFRKIPVEDLEYFIKNWSNNEKEWLKFRNHFAPNVIYIDYSDLKGIFRLRPEWKNPYYNPYLSFDFDCYGKSYAFSHNNSLWYLKDCFDRKDFIGIEYVERPGSIFSGRMMSVYNDRTNKWQLTDRTEICNMIVRPAIAKRAYFTYDFISAVNPITGI